MNIGAWDTGVTSHTEQDRSYGTHTLPKEFWSPEGIKNYNENHTALMARRKEKSARAKTRRAHG